MDLFDDLPPPVCNEKIDQNGGQKVGSKRQGDAVDCREESKSKRSKDVKYKLRGFVAERKGEREDMQDAHVILDEFLSEVTPAQVSCNMSYYAVFDGHVGPRASQFAAKHLHENIKKKIAKVDCHQSDKEIKKCLVDAYSLTDEQFLIEASKETPTLRDGSTAVSVLVIDDVLYAANLGDSKALLCRYNQEGKTSVIPLTKDHSPSEYNERMRIQKAGGSVKDGRVQGILEVSRSFGDGRFKHCGVVSTPDIKRCTLTDNDRFLVLACDGLWKGFSVDAAVKYINNIINDESIICEKEIEENKGMIKDSAEMDPVLYRFQTACNRIASDAIRNGSSDNVTVMIVSITS
ncbi:integrin-linked kinase-associated serine/threonine phosphatase 2C isoform X2 [Exaiptasia diaphana]|uniref:PPM-type phosphatase domain-containing protein n=1 Tax=Exaiptasia diaphana TaxID=2652724 RepID=A0A913WP07_EXADI|nr:integrin-linked kinase-associated serine/threonine phosphatase 2C isoform X2 [Exaiptasia diaphana]KXJ19103.1 Integrin-linked kinase-associated serine/threonine phosphatase 2C [Exaiptasia diaphana]